MSCSSVRFSGSRSAGAACRMILPSAAICISSAGGGGALPHDPACGSYLHRRGGAGGALNEKALAACREALAPMPGVRVRSADCQFSPDAGRLHVRVGLEAGHQNYQLEVTV